jgi:glycosyltransferase involved in cell wall biosynthesis
VVVASHGRELRLRWLLNALEDQEFQEPWEILVVHDYDAGTARRVLDTHALARRGVLRHLPIEPGTGSPSRQRNVGWRAAKGEVVAFTDDDCRPEREWIRELLRKYDGGEVIVQGRTRPDPFERPILAAPHVRTMAINPVGPFAQTCNILYPRALLEHLGGFDEIAISGEDVGLSLRARAAGAVIVAAPDAIVNHAIESHTLPGIVRQNLKWRHLAYLVRRHPEFRRQLVLRLFWDADHARTAVGIAGLMLARRDRRFAVLCLPYVRHALRRRGQGRRARAVSAVELPGQAVRQAAEIIGLAAGSVRHRSLVL